MPNDRVSIELVTDEVRRFLSTKEPEVICIKGHWGVGKTFAWHQCVEQTKCKIAMPKYSYVSLFGINSLEQFKYAIFENSVGSSDVGIVPSLDTLQSNTAAVAKQLSKRSIPFLQQLPKVKSVVGGLGPVWFLMVKDMVICVDDIERRGRNLSVREVLGLVSNLRERKRCKVCLILNDEALDEDKKDFDAYFEKVVDTSLQFEPSPEECARIALVVGQTVPDLVRESCVKLQISNIRLIKRTEHAAFRLEELVKTFDEQVLKLAIPSLTVLGWSVYDPTKAPSLEFLRKRTSASVVVGRFQNAEPLPPKEAAWNALLDAFNWSGLDEFDEVLLDGIRNGYFNPSGVMRYAAEIDARAKASKATRAFKTAWGMYHDSFANNGDQVLDALYKGFREGVQHLTPLDLNGTAWVLKELGRQDQATEMITLYIKTHESDAALFDLESYAFAGRVDEPEVVQRFREKSESIIRHVDAEAVMRSMAEKNGWSPEDITALAALPVDEYYGIFKKYAGKDLHNVLNACLQFDRIENASAEMKEIATRAKEALARIGRESRINTLRVGRYGVRP